MEKSECRAVIKFFVLEGLSATEIHTELVKVLKDAAPSFSTVHRWTLEFKRGRTSISDDPRSGRPKSATTHEIINSVREIVANDKTLTLSKIAEAVRISDERVLHILKDELALKKLFSKWVPSVLTREQKQQRIKDSAKNLELFKTNKEDFFMRYVTMDEIWINYAGSETKKPIENQAKRQKIQQAADKVLVTVFWDADGVIFLDYVEQQMEKNVDYYKALLERFKIEIKRARPQMADKKLIFHQDNALCQNAIKLDVSHFELLPHLPLSPDLDPSAYYLFVEFRKKLQGKKYRTKAEVIEETAAYFEYKKRFYYKRGIEMLEKRWTDCIKLEGDYVEE